MQTSYTLETSIKCLKYSKLGTLLFLGDKFGCLYVQHSSSPSLFPIQTALEIPEGSESLSHSINKIEVQCSSQTRALILTSIDKSIKSWKIFPQPSESGCFYTGKLDRTLEGVHECTINSLTMCANESNFISSDDLNLYLWDITRHDQVCHIVNHKHTVNEINEVITSTKFHPTNTSNFLWTSTNGTIRIGDLRTKLIMDKPVQSLKYNSSSSWYYEDLVQSISYAEFCQFHQTVIARDYFTVKFWDLRNASNPSLVTDVVADRNLTMREICESQAIFYDFEAKDCHGSEFVLTGGRGEVVLIDRVNGKVQGFPTQNGEFVVHVDIHEDDVAFASDSTVGFMMLGELLGRYS